MHQNISLGSNGVDLVRSLLKILKQLRGTNFCTSSAHFAPSFVRKANGPECNQIVRNTTKHQFRVDGVFQMRLLWKILTRLHGTNFCTSSARFTPSFVTQPNGPNCNEIVRNALNRQFRVQCGDWMHSLWKISTRLRGRNFCTSVGPLCTEFCKATKRSQMHPNIMKHTKMSF